MTTAAPTPTAPTVTPCPVDWCPDNGGHEWYTPTWNGPEAESADPSFRHHKLTVLAIKTGEGTTATVEAEAYEREGDPLMFSVQIPFEPELFTWQQANQVIDAIRYAATTAFGPEEGLNNPETPTPAQLTELDRWLRDPADARTVDQVRAAIADLGDGPAEAAGAGVSSAHPSVRAMGPTRLAEFDALAAVIALRQTDLDDALARVVNLAERPEGGWTAAADDALFAAVLRLRDAYRAVGR